MKTHHKAICLIFFLCCGIITTLRAQESKRIRSNLDKVTVFFEGAELVHTSTVLLNQGENEILIEELSPYIDRNSIKVKTADGVIVSSYEFSIDKLSSGKDLSAVQQQLSDSIDIYKIELEQIAIDDRINKTLMKQLQQGIDKNVSGSEEGLGIDELIKTIEYLKDKSVEFEKENFLLKRKKEVLENNITRLESQMQEEKQKSSKTLGLLRLNLRAARAGNSLITISYFTSSAKWESSYDIQVAAAEAPVVIRSRAGISQNTGVNWERVNLTLSTAHPGNGKVAPLFSAWFLSPRQHGGIPPRASGLAVQNTYSYRELKVAEEEKPMYIVDGDPMSAEEFQLISPDMIKNINILKDASQTAIYGSRAASGVVLVTLKDDIEDYIVTTEQPLDITYSIDLPYTIPGNGKVQQVDLRTYEVNATYKHYSTPKLDTQTYLLAEIAGWEKLGLLSGKANISYEGTYLGETWLNTASTGDNLTLTLGTDPRVMVKREKLQDFSSRRVLGSDIQQQFTYQITVRNNRNHPVKMIVKDQYPLSTQKNIEVTLNKKDVTPWTAINEQVGVISWEDDFAPGETRVYQISYSVKYPKGMNLNL